MLNVDPSKRYTVQECLNHPFIQKNIRKNGFEKCPKSIVDKIESYVPPSKVERTAL